MYLFPIIISKTIDVKNETNKYMAIAKEINICGKNDEKIREKDVLQHLNKMTNKMGLECNFNLLLHLLEVQVFLPLALMIHNINLLKKLHQRINNYLSYNFRAYTFDYCAANCI